MKQKQGAKAKRMNQPEPPFAKEAVNEVVYVGPVQGTGSSGLLCPKCKAKRVPSASFCFNCGLSFAKYEQKQAEQEQAEAARLLRAEAEAREQQEQVRQAAKPFVDRLTKMSDFDLFCVVMLLNPIFRGLITECANEAGKSVGHVQRVVEGGRKSHEMSAIIGRKFRAKLQEAGLQKLL